MDEPSLADNRILWALYRFHYLTPLQLRLLLFSPASQRYAERKLKYLSDTGYVLRDWIPTKGNRGRGNRPSYYTLSTKGMTHLSRIHGVERRRVNPITATFIQHSLDVSGFLVQAAAFTKLHPDFRIVQGYHNQELAEMDMKVKLRSGRERTVTPDGWLDMQSEERRRRLCIALEVQRSILEQRRWHEKIEGLLAWAATTMKPVMKTRDVNICFVATHELAALRDRDTLVKKTEQVLTRLKMQDWARILFFWGGSLKDISTEELFTQPVWHQPFLKQPVPLLELE